KAIGAMIGWRAFGIGKIKEKITSTIIGSFLVDEGTDAIQKVFIDPFMIRPGTYWSLEGVYTKTSWHSGRTETIEIRIYPDYLEVWQSTASTYMGMHQVTAPMLIASKNRD
ncbi:MAG: hypothetical protein II266_07730, partial [Clostridia bacterium]|nr:hypothetical protein [Clostridia bacterium]